MSVEGLTVTTLASGIICGLVIKITYDWFTAGKTFITTTACAEHREGCIPMAALRQEVANQKVYVDTKFHHIEAEMSDNKLVSKKVAEDIAEIKTSIAVITSWVKSSGGIV